MESRKFSRVLRARMRIDIRLVLTWKVRGVRATFADDDDGVLVESRLGVLWSVLWKMCFLMESPMERHADDDLSRLTNRNGVPEGGRRFLCNDRGREIAIEEREKCRAKNQLK